MEISCGGRREESDKGETCRWLIFSCWNKHRMTDGMGLSSPQQIIVSLIISSSGSFNTWTSLWVCLLSALYYYTARDRRLWFILGCLLIFDWRQRTWQCPDFLCLVRRHWNYACFLNHVAVPSDKIATIYVCLCFTYFNSCAQGKAISEEVGVFHCPESNHYSSK